MMVRFHLIVSLRRYLFKLLFLCYKNGRNYRDSLVNIFSVERSSQESRGFSHERFKLLHHWHLPYINPLMYICNPPKKLCKIYLFLTKVVQQKEITVIGYLFFCYLFNYSCYCKFHSILIAAKFKIKRIQFHIFYFAEQFIIFA